MTLDEFRQAAAERLDRVECPTCKATGKVRYDGAERSITGVCSTCNGTRVLFRVKRGHAAPDAPGA